MNLAALDLNLLVALDALLTECHVGRAARRIGRSQPATSHALQRVRDLIGDPLLVRTGVRMEPTPRALALRGPLADALQRIRGLLSADAFAPAASTRRFAVMMPDHVVDLLVPPLIERVAAAAPGIRIDVTPWRGPALMTPELARSIDLVVACIGDEFAGFDRQRLYSDRDALAVRRGHPAGARLSRLPEFLAARHVAVVGRGHTEDPIDAWLREHGVVRHIALVVPSYLQAMRMIARSDLVAFVPGRLIAALAEPLALRALAPPIDPGMDDQILFSPSRATADPGSRWLRGQLLEIGQALDGTSETPSPKRIRGRRPARRARAARARTGIRR